MKRLGVTGHSSTITRAFLEACDYTAVAKARDPDGLPFFCDDYLLCAGVLHGRTIKELNEDERAETLRVNFSDVAAFCDKLFEENAKARVCVIGSHSGVKGSYDMAYAGAKAALHLYVETKELRTAEQHLVCVAPTVIEDSGMTWRRSDISATLQRGKARRLGRWLHAEEVARVAQYAINEPALCNAVINTTGGNW